jgi:gamma-glutamylcyclotransferase
VPGRGYRHLAVHAENVSGARLAAVTYIAAGKAVDGQPSMRYLSLLRDGARAHGLRADYIAFLEGVEQAR